MKKVQLNKLPKEIKDLILQRNQLRKTGKFAEGDIIREKLLKQNIILVDQKDQTQVYIKDDRTISQKQKINHLIALFGSGETSATGRKIHEYLIQNYAPPVKIALLETPAGFETNPDYWYINLQKTLETGLRNFKPDIIRIEAYRKNGEKSTNNPKLGELLLNVDYIHTGAGSPTFAEKNLRNSLVYRNITQKAKEGITCSFASAAAIAFGKFLLPVYEIYKAGEDLHWKKGLNFFGQWGLNITIIPHWNNNEGGKDIDTSRCFMGKKRFEKLLKLLPTQTTVLGIDEQTACILDTKKKLVQVLGNGSVTVIEAANQAIFPSNAKFTFSRLKG